MTSHAAVVARGMGKPCVAGCEASTSTRRQHVAPRRAPAERGRRDHDRRRHGPRDRRQVPLVPPAINEDFETILELGRRPAAPQGARERRHADDAAKAREFGAQGIGLCRTEHMFFGEDRLPVVQEMILARDERGRRAALDRLLPFQQSDFEAIFEAMAGLPVTIRLLDPPLHEFLPPLEEATSDAHAPTDQGAHRVEPDARHPRLPARSPVAGDLRDAGAGDRRAAKAVPTAPARRRSSRSCIRSSASREELRRLRELTERVMAEEAGGRVPLRDDDRAAARRASAPTRSPRSPTSSPSARTTSRRRRSASRATTRRGSSSPSTSRRACSSATRSRCSTGGRRRPDADRGRAGAGDEAGHQARDLRRARRRAALGGVLPRDRARLRHLLALPRPARAPRRGAGRARGRGRRRRSPSAAELGYT